MRRIGESRSLGQLSCVHSGGRGLMDSIPAPYSGDPGLLDNSPASYYGDLGLVDNSTGPISNLRPETDHPDYDIFFPPKAVLASPPLVRRVQPRPLPFTSFPIHY